MNFETLASLLKKPAPYTEGSAVFWRDEHISKALLDAHLNPAVESASRKPSFLDTSAEWISKEAPPLQYPRLLDLGCGPGLYAERFHRLGYSVTGIDFSERSIRYATAQAGKHKMAIDYLYKDYLSIDYRDKFDVITLIYCDYGALSPMNRCALLEKAYAALRPNGKFILDVFSLSRYQRNKETRTWEYCENGGFWSEKPYICLDTVYHYDEEDTELRQSVVQTEAGVNCYNVWEQFFTKDSLLSELTAAKFNVDVLYGSVAGEPYSETGDTICGIFTK